MVLKLFKKNTMRGYYPTLLYRFKFNFKSGFRLILSNYNTWKLSMTSNDKNIWQHLFWLHLTAFRWFEDTNSFLPLNEYHWIVEYLHQEGFYDVYVGGYAPFTIEGKHHSGLEIYFRSRGSTSFTVYNGVYDWYNNDFRFESTNDYIFDESEAFQHFYFHYSDIKDYFNE